MFGIWAAFERSYERLFIAVRALGNYPLNQFLVSLTVPAFGLLTVVIVFFPRLMPVKPILCISRSTVHLANLVPCRRSWCQTLQVP